MLSNKYGDMHKTCMKKTLKFLKTQNPLIRFLIKNYLMLICPDLGQEMCIVSNTVSQT